MRRELAIKSIFTGEVWRGSLELPSDDQAALGKIFRLFNRVDDEDIDRLEKIGYRLPSLSVGDRVDLDSARYWANSVGWTKSWDDLPEYARVLPRLREEAVRREAEEK